MHKKNGFISGEDRKKNKDFWRSSKTTYNVVANYKAHSELSFDKVPGQTLAQDLVDSECCGSVGRMVASNTWGPRFKSSHQKNEHLINVNFIKRRKERKGINKWISKNIVQTCLASVVKGDMFDDIFTQIILDKNWALRIMSNWHFLVG